MPLQNAPHISNQLNQISLHDLQSDLESLWSNDLVTPQETIDTLYAVTPLKTTLTPVQPTLSRPASTPQKGIKKRYLLGLTTALIATGVAGQQIAQYSQAQEAKKASHQLQKVMYQNLETKVAAFRQEVKTDTHFMVEQTKPIQYTTKTGDTVKKLAQKFHVNPNTIIKNNERKKLKSEGIKPGTKLTILPVNGISHPIAKNETIAEISKRYDIKVKDIIHTNDIKNPHLLREKQEIIIPNATELKLRPKKKISKPAKKQVFKSFMRNSAPKATGRRLSWPAAGTLTSNFGWRWFRMHNGIDIAGPVGTAIKAAKEGKVVYSGWMGGYGYAIDIQHPGGIRTRYAHNSALYVRVGQRVGRGQKIAAMGSTGHSTGPHLHFEVHLNGRAVNPRSQF